MCRLWRTRATPAYDGLWFWGIAPSPAPGKAKKFGSRFLSVWTVIWILQACSFLHLREPVFLYLLQSFVFSWICVFPLIFVHFLGFMYFLYCLWWIVIWIVLVAPPLARDGGKNREKKPFWWQSRCLSPSSSYRTLYADRVNVTKWGKKEDVMMMILLRAVLFGESISVPFPPCQGCVRWRCLHCISNTFRNIIKGESRLQAICEEGKCFFFSMASKQPTLLEPPPCFCVNVIFCKIEAGWCWYLSLNQTLVSVSNFGLLPQAGKQ